MGFAEAEVPQRDARGLTSGCGGVLCFYTTCFPHLQELTYETIEDVVETSGVEPRVIEEIFGQLKRLETYNY